MEPDFGRYRLLGELARGANGIVYRALDPEMGRVVALKSLRGDEPGPAARERFLREARLAASLRHPNIVPVYDAGEHEGRPFYTMPLLEGGPPRGPIVPAEACRLVARVADAVAYAHSRGVVHRDLKPGNIVVCGGEPVLTDFGMARGALDVRMTETGELLGTPAYMSPEQIRGNGKDADGKADVFALGVILFELLTGRLPEDGDSFLELSARRLNDPVPELVGFDPGLTALVRACLAKDPADRPVAAALARRLERWTPGPRRRWGVALPMGALLIGAALWAGATPTPAPDDLRLVRVPAGRYRVTGPGGGVREVDAEEFWIDRDEAPARAAGFSYLDGLSYCLKRGLRLPTEEEWEIAAGGAGAAGESPFGCRDMARNLAEWTATPGRSDPELRVVRGGHWKSPPEKCGPGARDEVPPTKRAPTLGVRCASTMRRR